MNSKKNKNNSGGSSWGGGASGGSGGGWGSTGGASGTTGGGWGSGGGSGGASGGGGSGGWGGGASGGSGGGWGSTGGASGATGGSGGGWGSTGGSNTSGGGWGSTAGSGGSSGWGGGGSSGGGWGTNNNNNAGGRPPLPPAIQSLVQWDTSYNSKQANCRFRTFLYSICPNGQLDQVVAQQQQQIAQQGGNIPSSDWDEAGKRNPDPQRLVPVPVHFLQGLLDRVKVQRQQCDRYEQHVSHLRGEVHKISTAQGKGKYQLVRLTDETVRIHRQLLDIVRKIEVMRQHGLRLGGETTLRDTVDHLKKELHQPNKYDGAMSDLEALLNDRHRLATSAGVMDDAALDEGSLADMLEYLKGQQKGLQLLKELVKKDLDDMKFVRDQATK
eukprot:PhM_4_TR9584/c0_g1_i1/m.57725/K14308/NUP54, NUP57; nuclear pore complex protein Nup54